MYKIIKLINKIINNIIKFTFKVTVTLKNGKIIKYKCNYYRWYFEADKMWLLLSHDNTLHNSHYLIDKNEIARFKLKRLKKEINMYKYLDLTKAKNNELLDCDYVK